MSKEARTERYEDLWLPPVPTAADLPAAPIEGQMCFAQDTEVTFAFQGGKWVAVTTRKADGPTTREPDDA